MYGCILPQTATFSSVIYKDLFQFLSDPYRNHTSSDIIYPYIFLGPLYVDYTYLQRTQREIARVQASCLPLLASAYQADFLSLFMSDCKSRSHLFLFQWPILYCLYICDLPVRKSRTLIIRFLSSLPFVSSSLENTKKNSFHSLFPQ